jgi:hypothetical protein
MNIILKNNQIVIPKELQSLIIQIGHESHQCAEKTKQLMNRFVWFPGMNGAIDCVIIEPLHTHQLV